jgi:hypothetical protein
MRQVFASGPEEQPASRSSRGAGPASPPAPPPHPAGGPGEPAPPGRSADEESPVRPDDGSAPPQQPGLGFRPQHDLGQRFTAPVQRPPTPRGQRKPPGKEAQQRGWSALALGLLSLLGLSSVQDLGHAMYALMLTSLIGAAGVWLGASAASRARRKGTNLPRGAVSGIVLGGAGLALSVILLAGFALLSSQLSTYSDCMKGANTLSAQQSCQSQFSQAVHNKISATQSGAGH